MPKSINPDELDALLPQTQCGLCGYGGCMPYAEAMVFEHAPLNLCPPGGADTLIALGKKLSQDIEHFIPEMQQKEKPLQVVTIREAECIGCTKCIQVCPVDAIFGAAKQMHTVITDLCTGCELCIPACPVDCIDLQATPPITNQEKLTKANHSRDLFNARSKRLLAERGNKITPTKDLANKQAYILQALQRKRKTD